MLALTTSLFFGLLVVASYFVIGYFIRGEEIGAPDLVARSVSEALVIAKRLNLSLELEREEPSETLEAGEVLSQRPRPGARIKSRTPIRVVVSSGRRQITLPRDMIGRSRLEAGIELRNLGLEVGNVSFLPALGSEADAVLALDPPAGSGVPPGTGVHLLVAADLMAGRVAALP